jgi:hypothetical protein
VDQVFAGLICGFGLSLVAAPLLGLTLVRMRADSALLGRLLPPGTNAVAFVVMLHGMLVFLLTGLGMVLGLLLLAMNGAGGALGSPNAPFTLFVAGLVFAIISPVAIVSARLRRAALAAGLMLIGVFGWLMPYLARWSNLS